MGPTDSACHPDGHVARRYLEWLLRQTEAGEGQGPTLGGGPDQDPPVALATTAASELRDDSGQVSRGRVRQAVRLLGGGIACMGKFASLAASRVGMEKIFEWCRLDSF